MTISQSHFTWQVIADNSEQFIDFAPYVASLDDTGQVAFQAALRLGGSGVFCGSGGALRTVVAGGVSNGVSNGVSSGLTSTNGQLQHVYSHPDINNDGAFCFYGQLQNGEQGVLLFEDGVLRQVSADPAALPKIGPLGPTMNARGEVAFRADDGQGRSGIHVARRSGLETLATVGETFSAFFGLPVINAGGQVLLRADTVAGRQGIWCAEGSALQCLVQSGAEFATLLPFPMMNDQGVVVFGATRSAGGAGIFLLENGVTRTVASTEDGFESVRGALINEHGLVVFYAVPVGGTLGLYAGADPVSDRLLGIGDNFMGAAITELVLNPVSVNQVGQIALRLALADGRQMIVRGDPRILEH